MNNISKLRATLVVLFLSTLFVSCVDKDFDAPPAGGSEPGITANTSIADLRAMYNGSITQILDDIVISGIVIADDRTGNFYKSLIIQDASSGIDLRLDANDLYNDYPIGRKIYIKCKNLYLDDYNGVIQLGGALNTTDPNDPYVQGIPEPLIEDFVFKGPWNQDINPEVVTIGDLMTGSLRQSTLIKLENVEFSVGDTSQTWADAVNQYSVNRELEDCNGNKIIVRTSGYSDFVSELTPSGNGSLIAILGEFGSDLQLTLRTPNEVIMNNARCNTGGGGGGGSGGGGSGGSITVLFKDFEDGSVYSGGWSTQIVTGPYDWGLFVGSNTLAKMTNFSAGNNTGSETWLISPAMDLSSLTTAALNFENTHRYDGDPLELYISTTYDGTSTPNPSDWNQLSFNIDTDNGSWDTVNSGDVGLDAYLQSTVYVAFRYLGTDNDGSTWEVDDILVSGEN